MRFQATCPHCKRENANIFGVAANGMKIGGGQCSHCGHCALITKEQMAQDASLYEIIVHAWKKDNGIYIEAPAPMGGFKAQCICCKEETEIEYVCRDEYVVGATRCTSCGNYIPFDDYGSGMKETMASIEKQYRALPVIGDCKPVLSAVEEVIHYPVKSWFNTTSIYVEAKCPCGSNRLQAYEDSDTNVAGLRCVECGKAYHWYMEGTGNVPDAVILFCKKWREIYD